jgi:hypothetical protein
MQFNQMIQSNNTKSFFIKMLVFVLIVVVVDKSVGVLLKHFYFKQNSGLDYKTRYAIDSTYQQMLIFGSSRAEWIYDPTILENELHTTCYNVGRNGHPIFYHYALLQSTLYRYKPSTIILNVDAGMLTILQDGYDRLATLLPYYQSHPEIRSTVDLKGPFEKLKTWSSIYPYNSLMLSTITGLSKTPNDKNTFVKGFRVLDGTYTDSIRTLHVEKDSNLDAIKIATYTKFIDDCKAAGCKLYIVCSPYIVKMSAKDQSLLKAEAIAKQKNIPYWDYSTDTFFTNRPYLFADFKHLNNKGVSIFTKLIADKIKTDQ